jgi:C-terminal processing protease CtpA/Prc
MGRSVLPETKGKVSMHRSTTQFLLFAIFFSSLSGCLGSINNWEGSVDAVFKYRSSENSTLVHEIRPQSFSEEAGLQAGDQLLAIDGKDITGATYQEVRSALRGPVGTMTTLTVQRGETIMDIAVERRPIAKK